MLLPNSLAATICESASQGQTGISTLDLRKGVPQGVSIPPSIFTSVRFQSGEPVHISHVRGHLVLTTIDGGDGSGSGAIVALEGESDFHDSFDLSSPDKLGSTLGSLPLVSAEVQGCCTSALGYETPLQLSQIAKLQRLDHL